MDHQVIKQKLHQWQATDINVSALGDLRSIGSSRSLKLVGERKLIKDENITISHGLDSSRRPVSHKA